MENNFDDLNRKKEKILQQIRELGDFRQVSLSPRYRKCGKPYCHCAKEGSKGHGPLWMVTRSVKGKTKSKAIPRGKAVISQIKLTKPLHDELDKLENYFRQNRTRPNWTG